MALILNIDTSIEIAGVCLSKDGATLITTAKAMIKKIMRHGYMYLLKK